MNEPERVLFVHAHPDDETLFTGGTIATLLERGAQVTVLTCTRGERGEVIPDDLQFALASPESLASLRVSELTTAMRVLGVTDHRFLGAENARWSGRPPRHYTDSGMRWGASGAEAGDQYDPASLTAADFGDVAADVAAVIIDVSPDVVISYDARGGYGHPDHIRAQQAARRAAEVYGIPFYSIERAPGASGAVDVDISPVVAKKRDALLAYPSQVVVDGDTYAFSNGDTYPIGRVESFRMVGGQSERSMAFADQTLPSRILTCVIATAIGAASGAILTVYHQNTIEIGSATVPLGLIVAVLLTAGLGAGARLAVSSRLVAAFTTVALAVVVALLSLESKGGSVLIPNNLLGLIWTVAPTVIAIAVLAWPKSRRRTTGRIELQASTKGPQLQ